MALVTVRNVSKRFCRDLRRSLRYGLQDLAAEFLPLSRQRPIALRRDEFWALQDVSFQVGPGEALALLGPNGAGKSTILKMLTGIIRPDAGEIRIQGRVASLIELGTGFNPVLSGRENIYVNAAVLGFDRPYVNKVIDQIIDFADIGDFLDAPVMNYSSGMYVRLAYAIAANLEPDVLLVDEVLAVGDAAFRRKCIRHMKRYVDDGGSLIVVSHTPPLLEIVCNRSIVLSGGQVDYEGSISDGIDRYFTLLGTDSLSSGLGASADGAEQVEQPSANPAQVEVARSSTPTEIEPLKITGIQVAPEAGDELLTGGTAIVTLDFHAFRPVEGVLWGLIFQAESEALDVAADVCPLQPLPAGRGQVRVRIPRIPFVPGRYTLRSALIDQSTQLPYDWVGWQDSPLRFRIEGQPGLLNTIRKWGGALVSVEMELLATHAA